MNDCFKFGLVATPPMPAFRSRALSTSAPSETSALLRVGAFVAASVLSHLAFAAVMPDDVGLPPLREAPEDLAIFFEAEEPEPEAPVVEPVEEEPLEEEPIEEPEEPPVRTTRVVPEPPPEPEATQAPEVESDEPPGGDPEATDEASAESGDLQGSVVSTEGGLAVDRVAGSGRDGAARGTVRRGSGVPEPTPTEPTVDRRALVRAWMVEVHRAVGRATYTRSLLRAELEGRVVIALLVDAEGRIQRVRVERTSGQPLLDEAALEQVSRFERVPPPPSELAWQPREIRLPIVYELRDRG